MTDREQALQTEWDLDRLERELNAAQERLAEALNAAFPVGCRVAVETGTGVMRGHVPFRTRSDRIAVRSRTGHVHWKHWRLVTRLAGDVYGDAAD